MKLIKLTALPLVALFALLTISSCKQDAELRKITDYSRVDIVLSGAQQTPAVASTALGKMDISYTKETRILSYTFNWSGLSGAVSAMRIHGLAPTGYQAAVVQTLSTSGIIKCPTISVTTCGTFSGKLLVDGVVVKEEDILSGVYYLSIYTSAYPGGEIRGQIKFD